VGQYARLESQPGNERAGDQRVKSNATTAAGAFKLGSCSTASTGDHPKVRWAKDRQDASLARYAGIDA